ncbi:SUMF1/EgtB/PvdO family nonheme iron enzyme [Crocosphaera watsonii]|uniref:Sulfatase-modifying factor enzyme-like domain-containing protein n=1 Tax=Crocosphaera watsonii WH 0003 TaxID=423471 RepID=G5IYA2_CROWT|nr:hypothetical protein CWATWH0003_0256 [Crocosphaera watsonii WH 0003]
MKFETLYLAKNKQNQLYSVLRGGSWGENPVYCRSAFRNDVLRREVRNVNYGFRVVCVFGRNL